MTAPRLHPVSPATEPSTRAQSPAPEAIAGGQLRVVIVGHVDHGKSTLIGRLFHETGLLPEGKLEAIQAMCRRRGMPFEWAFLMDSLKAERDQGVTIDAAQIWLRRPHRNVVFIDAPGHQEFIRNMVSGAAGADAALIMIDAEEGIRRQSRLHGYLLDLLGVGQVAVLVNKMDLVDRSAARFQEIERDYRAYLQKVGVEPELFVPISARDGDNVVARSAEMDWYDGPTVLDLLDRFRVPRPATALPLRLPVQDVYKFDKRRIIAGRVESGRVRVGDRVLFSPSNKEIRVAGIEAWNAPGPVLEAHAGQSVGLTLEDQLFVERGEIISHGENPPIESDVFHARLFWLSRAPLRAGRQLEARLATARVRATVERIERVIDVNALTDSTRDEVKRDEIAEVVLRTDSMLAFDEHHHLPRTGRVVLVDGYEVVGGGLVSLKGYPDQRDLITVRSTNIETVEHRVSRAQRAQRNRHRGGVLWLTGLSGAGKSTLAMAVEQRLFELGYQVYVLDGDNVRHGLNANLSFSPEDRAENIRRVGELAALFADAGFVVVTAFISPYRADRHRAREAAERLLGAGGFVEVFVDADLETCESRDPKGLYKKARAGEIKDFTGISAPYEVPAAPELVVETGSRSVQDCVSNVVAYVEGTMRGGDDGG